VVIVGFIIYNLAGVVRQPGEDAIQSLVLLPFDNFTGDDQLEYFVAGMHSSLIGEMKR
jgi:TolB-like protein